MHDKQMYDGVLEKQSRLKIADSYSGLLIGPLEQHIFKREKAIFTHV